MSNIFIQPDKKVVNLYDGANFDGYNVKVRVPYSLSNFVDWGWNDKLASLKVPNNVKITLYRDSDYSSDIDPKGIREFWPGDYDGYDMGDDLMDQVSSFKTEYILPPEEEAALCCLGIPTRATPSSEGCGKYWKNNGGVCDSLMSEIITADKLKNADDKTKRHYKTWCIANPGECDDAVYEYCGWKDDKCDNDDPICACICSGIHTPQCFDKNCSKRGYQTKNMNDIIEKAKCPPVPECAQDILITDEAKDNLISGIVYDQNCGTKHEYNFGDIFQNPIVMVFMFLLVVFISVVIYQRVKGPKSV